MQLPYFLPLTPSFPMTILVQKKSILNNINKEDVVSSLNGIALAKDYTSILVAPSYPGLP